MLYHLLWLFMAIYGYLFMVIYWMVWLLHFDYYLLILYEFIIVTTLLLILSWLIVIDAMQPAVGRPSPSFVWASNPKMLRIWRRWLRGVLVNKVCQFCPVWFQEEIQQNNTNSEIWLVCVQLQPLFDTGHVCKFRVSPWSISLFRPNKSGDSDGISSANEALERGLRLLHRADPSVSVEAAANVIGPHVLIHGSSRLDQERMKLCYILCNIYI
jgi:hypothetical protein